MIEFERFSRLLPKFFRFSPGTCRDAVAIERLDVDWYCSTYTDIHPAYAVSHYDQAGWREGRSPHANFSTQWYTDRYPGVASAGIDPCLHFQQEGREAGHWHAPHRFWDPKAWTANHGGVDPEFYRCRYPEIGAVVDPAAHYAERGWVEGKDPNLAFSTSWYLSRNADIAAAGLDPLHHYLMHGRFEGRSPKPNFMQTIRFEEWGVCKLSMAMATVYATAVLLGIPIASIWPLLVLSLVALGPGAAYVALINDLCDREDDRAAGKANRMQERSPWRIMVWLAGCILPGAAVAVYWHRDGLVVGTYLAAWLAFSAYSLPPFRLKERGFLGPLADAAGAHVFPNLFLVASVFGWADVPVDWVWLAAIGVWSAGVGLRGILQHQVMDRESDALAAVETYAHSAGVERVRLLGCVVIFPPEVLALAVLLMRVGSVVPIVLLAAFLALEAMRRAWGDGPVVLVPATGPAARRLLLFPYYEIWMPLAFLASSPYFGTLLIVVAHALLFTCAQVKSEVGQIHRLYVAYRSRPGLRHLRPTATASRS